MLRHNAVAAMLAAAMLVLAGCSGAVPGGAGGDGGAGDAALTDGSGTVTLYVSDQPGAMADFEHLNVTVDRVAYHRTNASDGGPDADGMAGNESDGDESTENETDAAGEDEREERDELESEDGWETYDINDTTVDLTELQGENATVVGQQRLPNGTYDKVFLYVSDVNGTLKDGDSTRVKLPSGKLQVEKRFTVGNNESLDFVFDATVVKAGKSGKYVLTPVVSESGTDVGIKEVAEDEESGVSARFVGSVDRGEAATVKVTQRGQPVAGATVEIGDEEYRTGGDGTVMFDVPADAEAVEIEVEYEGAEVKLTRKFPGGEEGDDDRGADRTDRDDGEERADGDGEERAGDDQPDDERADSTESDGATDEQSDDGGS